MEREYVIGKTKDSIYPIKIVRVEKMVRLTEEGRICADGFYIDEPQLDDVIVCLIEIRDELREMNERGK